ncbi:protein draper isoform X2 [Drosophila busckii]|nr:protein draper isoform X2 [Drosophila busckii]
MMGPSWAMSTDLIDFTCRTDKECESYENAKCLNLSCSCTARGSNEPIECKPKDEKLTNIIGGPCPCSQPHSVCNMAQQLCYCTDGHVPSKDKRRCISEWVSLDMHCETMRQCQLADTFSACQATQHRCLCKENFEQHLGKCRAVLDISCNTDADCKGNDYSLCLQSVKKCACDVGYVQDRNMTACAPGAVYGASCSQNAQCHVHLGAGSMCLENSCACRAKHYHSEKQLPLRPTNSSSCEPLVPYGGYCRRYEDCQLHHMDQQLKANHTTNMQCRLGECACQDGYVAVGNEVCVPRSAGALAPKALLLSTFLYILSFITAL